MDSSSSGSAGTHLFFVPATFTSHGFRSESRLFSPTFLTKRRSAWRAQFSLPWTISFCAMFAMYASGLSASVQRPFASLTTSVSLAPEPMMPA